MWLFVGGGEGVQLLRLALFVGVQDAKKVGKLLQLL